MYADSARISLALGQELRDVPGLRSSPKSTKLPGTKLTNTQHCTPWRTWYMYMYISVYVHKHQCIYIECTYMKDKDKEVLLHTSLMFCGDAASGGKGDGFGRGQVGAGEGQV